MNSQYLDEAHFGTSKAEPKGYELLLNSGTEMVPLQMADLY
jgi:hypothetical protein